jgi:hypothetical protein
VNGDRRYFSDRKRGQPFTAIELYERFVALHGYFDHKEFFFEKTESKPDREASSTVRYEARAALGFDPFSFPEWKPKDDSADRVFDTIEFLYDHVSKPGEWGRITSDGWNYDGYKSFDADAGRAEFRARVNVLLGRFATGFELTPEGKVVALGEHGLRDILNASIPHYDEENVDKRVRDAISKWRDRRLDMSRRREAIREMADVFEWLKKTGRLKKVLASRDDSDIFNIANNFAIRHHRPSDKRGYDKDIWYPWMFHFYLATYHAVIRMLIKLEQS